MGMEMMSLKWEGIGTKNLFPHTSTAHWPIFQTVKARNNRYGCERYYILPDKIKVSDTHATRPVNLDVNLPFCHAAQLNVVKLTVT